MLQVRHSPARIAGIAVVVCLTTLPASVGAPIGGIDLTEGNRALAKVSSHLLRARALARDDKSAAEIAAALPSLRLRDGLPEVEIRLETLTPEIVARLRARGLRVESFHLGYARAYGRLDPADLDEIAALPEVSTISPMPIAGTRVGAVTNQADDTMRAVNVRVYHNADGSFVTAGVLSDSFNAGRGGTVSGGACDCAAPGSTCATVVNGMANQDSGDLPPSIPILDDCTVGPPNCSGLIDEGAAIGELIFDIVPGAGFLFHSAFNSPADFAGGISELANCGADLIVDDVFWTGQPFFQDGIIAQAAQGVVDNGVPYVSAAGNGATFGVHDSYADNNPASDLHCGVPVKSLPGDGDLHAFAGGDAFAAITVPDECSVHAELQWNEPFDGTLGDGASSDLDLYLLSSDADPQSTGGGNVLDASITAQGCGIDLGPPSGGNPQEAVSYDNRSGAPATVFLAVDHCCGDEGVDLRIVTLSLDCNTTGPGWEFEDGDPGESAIFVDPQLFGHPAARGVVAVGAAFYGEIDTGGAVEPPFAGQLDVEPFSSLGGDLPFYFADDGSPLPMAPQLRKKPELAGPDGTDTTFLGEDTSFDPGSDPNFFGTSAAAANVAAVAAQLLDLTNKLINPDPLTQLIQQASRDMEVAGADDLSGFGFLDAMNAARSLVANAPPLIDDLAFDLGGGEFLRSPPSGMQRVQAIGTLTVGNGVYEGLEGRAGAIIFTDGFESGDTSTWRN